MDLLTPLRAGGESPVTGTKAPLCRLGNARLRHGPRYESRVYNSAPSLSGHTARCSGRRAHLDCVSWNFAILAQTAGDRAFLAWAVQIEIQQQDMGRIAERRAQTAAVREFGSYLVQRHQQAQQRLETVASRLGAAPSSKLSATHLRVQSHFRSIPSGSFDRAFIGHEIGDYRYFLQHFEAASRTGGGACSAVRHERNCESQGRSGQNHGSGRRGDLTAPTTEFLLKPRPPQPQRVADHADGGRDMAAAAMIGDNKTPNTG
jgi:predicted outer membrane protein